jgi:hypothetical protein
MLPAYGAQAGFVVVPDGSPARDDEHVCVAVVELSNLASAVDRALGGSQ